MANVITIPKLNASPPQVRVPMIDDRFDPYAPVAQGLGNLGAALEYRQRQDLLEQPPTEEPYGGNDQKNPREADDPVKQRDAQDAHINAISRAAKYLKTAFDKMRQDVEDDDVGPGYLEEWKGENIEIDERTDRGRGASAGEQARRRSLPEPYVLHQAALLEGDARARARIKIKVDVFDALASDALAHPGDQNYLADAQALLENLPEEERERLKPRVDRVARSWIWGLIRENPKSALERLRNGSEDFGLSDTERALYILLAEQALEDETRRAEAEAQNEKIRAHEEAAHTMDEVMSRRSPPAHAYEPALDFPEHAHALETLGDETRERVQREMESIVAAGKAIVARKTPHNEAAEGVDGHFEALEKDMRSSYGRLPEDWIAQSVKVIGRTPKKVRETILAGLEAKDPAQWAAAARLLSDLSNVDANAHGLLEWAPPEAVNTAKKFAALHASGIVNDAAKFKILTNGTDLGTANARREYFERHLDQVEWFSTIAKALNVEMDDLVYRPDEDGEARAKTLPYDGTPMRAQPLSYIDASPGMTWGGSTPPDRRDFGLEIRYEGRVSRDA